MAPACMKIEGASFSCDLHDLGHFKKNQPILYFFYIRYVYPKNIFQFCGPCLRNRYGEEAKEALKDEACI